MSRWAFRSLLFYICILFTQPQNRFLFLYPFHIADISVMAAVGLHVMSAAQENRPIIRMGPATIVALLLMVFSYLSLYVGPLQLNSHWNPHIDVLYKSVIVMIMIEAMADTVSRVWAVQATVFLATLWWIKGGIRLALAGATYSGDRIMGPAVGLVENPNGFAYMLCVILPLYLYFYQQSKNRWMKWGCLALALADVFLVLKTGSRTGLLVLGAIALFLLPKYGRNHKRAIVLGGVAVFLLLPKVGALNMERFKSIPTSIASFFSGSIEEMEDYNQDQQSALERQIKNRHTIKLILQYPIFGVGILPDEGRFPEGLWGAAGQVHNEILMAGKQMGIIGMSLYVALIVILMRNGAKAQAYAKGWWPAVSDLGWTCKLQAVAIIVGGFFSPIPWNAVLFILAGSSASLYAAVRRVPIPPTLPDIQAVPGNDPVIIATPAKT